MRSWKLADPSRPPVWVTLELSTIPPAAPTASKTSWATVSMRLGAVARSSSADWTTLRPFCGTAGPYRVLDDGAKLRMASGDAAAPLTDGRPSSACWRARGTDEAPALELADPSIGPRPDPPPTSPMTTISATPAATSPPSPAIQGANQP